MTPQYWTPAHIANALSWRAKSLVHKAKLALHRPLMERLGSTVAVMARTGVGTEACLSNGALPMPVHFYSPVPDIPDLQIRRVWDRRSRMEGIDFAPDRQLAFLGDLGRAYGNECNWPHKAVDPMLFHTDNSGFSYGCASSLHGVLRHYKPRRVIEVGSGNSTRVISAALRLNRAEGRTAEYIVIDPYPSADTRRMAEITRFEVERVELIDPAVFDQLEENDVLFVDSGHTVRIGGDVNFMILDVLPRLKPGVVVHFHDIPMPFEYNEIYFTNPAFRMFWTESYLLQAFLSLNESYETLLAMSWIMADHREAFAKAFTHYNPAIHVNNSSSYWIRRVR